MEQAEEGLCSFASKWIRAIVCSWTQEEKSRRHSFWSLHLLYSFILGIGGNMQYCQDYQWSTGDWFWVTYSIFMICHLSHNNNGEAECSWALNWWGRRQLDNFLSSSSGKGLENKVHHVTKAFCASAPRDRVRRCSSCGTEVWCDYTVSKIAITFNYLAGCTN